MRPQRPKAARTSAAIGFLLTAAGLILFTRVPVDGSYLTDVLPPIVLASLGMGAVFMPLTLIATTGLSHLGGCGEL